MNYQEEFRKVSALFFSFKEKILKNKIHGLAVFYSFAFVIAVLFAVSAPGNFPEGRLVTIEDGSTLSETATHLKERHVIRSTFLFKTTAVLLGAERDIRAGDYFFEEPVSVFIAVKRVTRGEFGLTPIRITFPEGESVFEMSGLLAEKFEEFDPKEFLDLALPLEGYLFPDTYFFLPNIKAPQVVRDMNNNFKKKIATIQTEIDAFGKPVGDVVTMASILEEEARKTEDRRMVSGILWNRIDIGMPLQVDATFLYINGKNTYELTHDDLAVDSLYNTYKYPGLPAGPITNPGLDSILAAVTPIPSEYLFYLSDRQGNMYYAKDFEDHKRNKALHIP